MEDPDAATLIDSIYDALSDDDAEAALALAQNAMGSGEGEDPVVRFLGGMALVPLVGLHEGGPLGTPRDEARDEADP